MILNRQRFPLIFKLHLLITKLKRFIAECVSKKIKSVNIWQSYKQERG